MKTFRIRPGSFKEIIPKFLVQILSIFLILIAALGWAFYSRPSFYISFPLSIILMAGAIWFTLIRQKKIFESQVLHIDEQQIHREILHHPPITIPKSAIEQIRKTPNGSFILKGNTWNQSIIIPAQIENREQLEQILTGIMPITHIQPNLFQKNANLLSVIGGLTLMGITFYSTQKILVGISGFLLVSALIYSFVYIQSSKHIDRRIKRSSYWSILALLWILSAIYVKLFR